MLANNVEPERVYSLREANIGSLKKFPFAKVAENMVLNPFALEMNQLIVSKSDHGVINSECSWLVVLGLTTL